ncbi:Protein AF-9-like protein [Smittium culicis]|uniref:Protein AF-9 homolog n=1 Tax=Smittium culicis TaxID=133412 RepID=A0A1R1YIQ3_9FUNG|nr:Protein AF-9-like protein [Smittium culicis]
MNKGMKRLKGVVISRPFIYGNVAVELSPQKQDHTHEWTVFVKSCDGSDLSHIITKVEIKLHETFVQSNRSYGNWVGRVRGDHSAVFPAVLARGADLAVPYAQAVPARRLCLQLAKTQASQQRIFSEPTEEFFEILMSNKSPGLPATIGTDHPFSLELELKEAKILDDAIEKTKAQYKEFEQQLETMKKEISQLKSDGFYF